MVNYEFAVINLGKMSLDKVIQFSKVATGSSRAKSVSFTYGNKQMNGGELEASYYSSMDTTNIEKSIENLILKATKEFSGVVKCNLVPHSFIIMNAYANKTLNPVWYGSLARGSELMYNVVVRPASLKTLDGYSKKL